MPDNFRNSQIVDTLVLAYMNMTGEVTKAVTEKIVFGSRLLVVDINQYK